VVKSLRRKLARDLWRLRYQCLSIALLVGCGVAAFIAPLAASASLYGSRDSFYADARVADIFVHLYRAPRPLLDRFRDLPGVAVVEGRIVDDFRLEIDGGSEPVVARFVSLTWPEAARLNQTRLVAGRQVEPGRSDEIVVNDAFAEAWHLKPGSAVTAVIKGRRATLRAVGIAVSPEFVWALSPRTNLPDPRHFGVVWMDGEALAKATGLVGAFNDAAVQLGVGADARETIERVDALLEPYGGLGAIARADQPSNKLVTQKIGQLARLAGTLPPIFLAVAAFVLHFILSRVVGTQREQIATLKALGYRTRELAWHYLELAAAVCALGTIFGVALGVLGTKALLAKYAQFFRFPAIVLQVEAWTIVVATAVAFGSALAGALLAVRKAVSIPPAEAMRPEAPPSFRPTAWDRAYRLLAPAARMVLRSVQRRPVQLLLSAASIAFATALMVGGSVLVDSIDEALRLQFEVSHREDLTITLDKARPWRAVREFAHLPGVWRAEGERVVPVRLRAGPRSRTTAIVGLRSDADLHRVLDVHTRSLQVPASGVLLSSPLGDSLGVGPGDEVAVEVLEAGRRKARVRIAGLVDDVLGLSGYMDSTEIDRLFDETPAANVVLLGVERQDLDQVVQRVNGLPAVASVSRPELDRGLVRAQVADAYFALQVLLALFAAAIAVGVVYNNARIALEERRRDLATLRILGFTRGELALVLLGEQSIQLLLGIAPGLVLGRWFGAVALASVDRELLRIPATLSPASQVAAVCVAVLAAFVSALRVRRQSDRLDLVAVLKARD
jgi:putative ABC transport system permease protein